MDIAMEQQFRKLKNIIDKAKRFSFGMKKEYLGPVDPVSIVRYGSDVVKINALVLAEGVTASYLPSGFDSGHKEAVIVYLDQNFEFQQYQSEINELMGLSLLVGDPEYSYDGTVAGAAEFFRNKNWNLNILYEVRSQQ
jgi:hypothetical protein